MDRSRVQLVGFIPSQKDHLAMYRDIDIALDTYPYHGTTTTLDSLLMGVPGLAQSNSEFTVAGTVWHYVKITWFIERKSAMEVTSA